MNRKDYIYRYIDGERWTKYIIYKRHGFESAGRNRLALKLQCKKESLAEYLMPQRKMRKYWEEPHAPLYGPLKGWTMWMKIKRARSRQWLT
jgi:hypothetical protein